MDLDEIPSWRSDFYTVFFFSIFYLESWQNLWNLYKWNSLQWIKGLTDIVQKYFVTEL